MNNDINLLHSKKRSVLSDLTTKLRLLRFGAILVLSLVALLSVAFFLLVVASPLPRLKEEEDSLLTSLSSKHAAIAQYTLLTSRLQDSNGIITKRMKMKETMDLFRSDLPEDVTLQSFQVEENVVSVRALSVSLEGLQTYLSLLKRQVTETKTLKQIQVSHMSLRSDGFELDVKALLP